MYLGLQAARGIAALLVVLLHATLGAEVFYGKPFDDFWGFGYVGVDFFFVLSGFIIFHAHRNDAGGGLGWKRYFIKRILRIYTAYLPISILMLGFYGYFGTLALVEREIGILPSLFLIPTGQSPALVVAWTLMHEMLFYCIFSIRFLNKQAFALLAWSWALAIVVHHLNPVSDHYLVLFLLKPYNLEFLAGMGVAWLIARQYTGSALLLPVGLTALGAFAIASYLAPNLIARQGQLTATLFLTLIFSMIVWGLCLFEDRRKPRIPNWLVFLGAASYSIYLLHNPAISALNRVAAFIHQRMPLPADLLFLAIVTLAVMAGIAYHLSWERPALNHLRQRWLKPTRRSISEAQPQTNTARCMKN